MPKYSLLGATTLCIGLGLFAYLQFSENQRLTSLVDLQEDQQSQLLEQVELNTNQRLELEQHIALLDRNLSAAAKQISNLSSALQEARENANPDIEAIQNQVQMDLENERLRNDPQSAESVSSLHFRSQAQDQMESMARMQMDLQYQDFLYSINVSADRKTQIEDLILSVLAEQNDRALRVSAGELDISEMDNISDEDYLANQLAVLLTRQELDIFKEYQSDMPERQLRRTYVSQVVMMAPEFSDEERNYLVDMMMDYMSPLGENFVPPSGSSSEAIAQDSLQNLLRLRSAIQTALDPEQLRPANRVLEQIQSATEMTLEMTRAINPQ